MGCAHPKRKYCPHNSAVIWSSLPGAQTRGKCVHTMVDHYDLTGVGVGGG